MPNDPEAGGAPPEQPGAGNPPPPASGVGEPPSQGPITGEGGGWPEDPDAWESGRPRPTSPEESLRRLEERLERASAAAERLMAEAAAEAASAGGRPNPPPSSPKPPPAGWQAPQDAPSTSTPDLEPLLQLLQAIRELIPPDLQRRLAAAVRELLLALRALIDWYLERIDHRHKEQVDVQDIPIL